ncbi:MAG: thioredoxin [Burkholderiaceae bacterium]|jgi:putative thioredoxin|nr:thioredoxin [Burkholderiaceae bacterium]MDO7594689.1 thioredoxin [Burkholderiaceae bacterium]MDO7605609.1 thioredoxin [Burkholderiaceae bacterium]MDO7650828.1 thioredoxin [Burkholderiaceae bacterium]MDO7668071.1 thioredoxin [Burkholderiaceae bacterium]
MIEVTIANFEAEVIEASKTTPVLVDFWAPWCGPCKTLGPLLERVETDYAGRFKLVKIDSDQEQQLAGAFGIRSIPTCVLLMNGQPVDGFTGAIPEGEIKAFLDKHLPAGEPEAEAAPEEDLPPASEEDALAALAQAAVAEPNNDDAQFAYIRALLLMDNLAQAKAVFEPHKTKALAVQRLASIALWLEILEGTPADEASLRAHIDANKRDFASRYALAQQAVRAGRWTDAMDELLEILMRDKSWEDERARRLFVAVLDIITPEPPKVAEGQTPPEDPIVVRYRRRLSSVVLS